MMGLRIFDCSWFIHYGAKSVKHKDYVFAGYPLGGVKFLVSNILTELLSHHAVVCCFDSQSNRYDLLPEYKSNRPRESYVYNQAEYAYGMLMKCGISCYRKPGFEADDLIASVVKRYRGEFSDIVCFSNDADIAHNVRDGVKLLASCHGGKDVTPHNFTASVVVGEVVEFNTISAYKVLIGDSSDKILQFKSEYGLSGRELYNRYVIWGNENLPYDERRPLLFSSKEVLSFFLDTIELSEVDRKVLNDRINIVFPRIVEDVEEPSVIDGIIRGSLAKLLTVLDDQVALERFNLVKERLSEEEFNEFKTNAQVLRDGTYAVDRGLPVHDSFVLQDLDRNMRLFD